MESEIEITNTDTKGWFEKTKSWSYENWQTILVILIVLIVGISAYNYNQQNNDDLNPAVIVDDNKSDNNEFDDETNEDDQENKIEETNSEIEETTTEVIEESKDQEEAEKEDDKATHEDTDKKEVEEGFSSLDDSGKIYTITASTGEGITHLARRALKMYTEETSDGSALTKEQKIYAEDYIQNRIGNEEIDTGHQETFSESLIKDAISNANSLSKESLKNLTKYVK